MQTLLLSLTLLATPPVTEARLWELVSQLQDELKGESAAEQLKADQGAAIDVMAHAATAGGSEELLVKEAGFFRCSVGPAEMFFGRPSNTPGAKAGELLAKWARASPDFVVRLSVSPVPFARLVALWAVDKQKPLFETLLGAAEKDPSPAVVQFASELATGCEHARLVRDAPDPDQLVENLKRAPDHSRLHARAQELNPEQRRCQTAAEAPPLVAELFQSGVKINGWGASGGQGYVRTAHGQQMSEECALAVYEGLRRRGLYSAELLAPLMVDYMSPAGRAAASKVAQRDLKNFPKEKQSDLAGKLVNAGLTAPEGVKVIVPDNPGWASAEQLEAAIRQKAPGAKEAIEKNFLCPKMGSGDTVALIGFIPTKEHADAAARIASTCKEGRAAAVAALVRMKDPRAFELIGVVFDDPWNRSELASALRENWSAEWERALRPHKQRPFFSVLMDAAGHPELAR